MWKARASASVLPTLFLLGFFAVIRLVDVSGEYMRHLGSIARIRSYYGTADSRGCRVLRFRTWAAAREIASPVAPAVARHRIPHYHANNPNCCADSIRRSPCPLGHQIGQLALKRSRCHCGEVARAVEPFADVRVHHHRLADPERDLHPQDEEPCLPAGPRGPTRSAARKNDDGRVFPIADELKKVIKTQIAVNEQWQREHGKICQWLFHRNGKKICRFERAFKKACREVGLPDRIPHDFRCTAARNLIRRA
jgi:hypothetical protein